MKIKIHEDMLIIDGDIILASEIACIGRVDNSVIVNLKNGRNLNYEWKDAKNAKEEQAKAVTEWLKARKAEPQHLMSWINYSVDKKGKWQKKVATHPASPEGAARVGSLQISKAAT
jgi:hypothetical protein